MLGAMRELGALSESTHLEVAKTALLHVDCLLALGQECAPMVESFRKEGKNAELFLERKALSARLKEVAISGDVVLLKGSRPFELWKVLTD